MVKKKDRPEDGPACPRCQTTNREARSFCRQCGLHLRPQPVERRTAPVEKRTPVARSTPVAQRAKPIKRGSPPAPVSASRASKREQRDEVVRVVHLRDRGCRAEAIHALIRDIPCAGPLDVHEVIPRSAWAAGYLDPDNCILICRNAHMWIDNHPNGAHALGFHGYSWERPAGSPILR